MVKRRREEKCLLPTLSLLVKLCFLQSFAFVFYFDSREKSVFGNQKSDRTILNSAVASASILGRERTSFRNPVVLDLPHLTVSLTCLYYQ